MTTESTTLFRDTMAHVALWLATLSLMALVLACGGNPASAPNDDEDPIPPGELAIVWDGHTVDWGAAEFLRAEIDGEPADVEWRSLSDLYLGQPVELGRGAETTTAPLRPGTTIVEARIRSGDAVVARDTAQVTVRYRQSWNMTLEGMVPYPDETVADVWVTGHNALVARRAAGGISIVDIDGLREIGRFTAPGLFTQDVKAAGELAFVSHEGPDYPDAVTILDLEDPTRPRAVGRISRGQTPTAHNLWIDGTTLYVAAPFETRAIHAWDVSDPATPRQLGTIHSTDGSAHDIHVRDGRVFGSFLPIGGNIGELVIAGAAPGLTRNSLTTYPGAFTHSSWLAADGRHLFVADEVVNAPIRIYDVSDPSAPVLVGRYQPRLGTIPHNFQVRDARTAYLAHYKHGVEVVDVSDPTAPRLAGFYDTKPGVDADVSPGPGGQSIASAVALTRDLCERHCLASAAAMASIFAGAWGVHWTDDGRIVVSDMNRGLFVFRYTGS
ncbi:MAG TPA: hypothetical protein VIE68_10120 [Gemmatimonadota bacterium]|jgi:hypothetical protein